MRSLDSRLRIPLCRLLPLPRIRLVQEVDVRRLEILFEDCDGYDDADRELYMSIYNDKETLLMLETSIELLRVVIRMMLMIGLTLNLSLQFYTHT